MTFYAQNDETRRGAAVMTDPSRNIYHDEVHQEDSADKFHFWLVVSMLAVFILLLFYSQKIQGLM